MEARRPRFELALTDPDVYVWYRFQGLRAKFTTKDGSEHYLHKGDVFGLRMIGAEYQLYTEINGVDVRTLIPPPLYVQLVNESTAVKQRGLDFPTVERRVRLSQKAFQPHMLQMVQKLGSNGTLSLQYLKVLSATSYSLMHCYGIAITRIKQPSVSTQIIHDPFVAKLLAFLIEGIAIQEIPKTRLNGYELAGVVTPRSSPKPMDLESRIMFKEGKVLLEKLIKSRIPTELTTLLVNETSNAMTRCNLMARELVVICAVLAELLNGNIPQARLNAQSLRLVRFTRN